MRSRTTTWENIAADGNFSMIVKARIDGTDYTSLTRLPVIQSDLATEPLSVGNCFAAEMQFSLRTNDTIAKGAEVILYIRLTTDSETSEWKRAGTFYISKRKRKNGVYDFTCYSRLLRANQPYVADPTASNARVGWPKSMQTVVSYICNTIGVTLDSRTVINTGDAYMVPFPDTKTMFEILEHIAGVHGGNFILTPDNTLRLVRSTYNASNDSQITASNSVTIPVIIGDYSKGETATVSRVTMTIDDDTGYTCGDDTGAELQILNNPYASQTACNAVYAQVVGTTYVPFDVGAACFDPMAELGDWIIVGGVVQGVIYSMTCTYGNSFRADISAPSIHEAEDEFPYMSPVERLSESVGKRFENVTQDYESKILQTRRAIELEVSAAVSKYNTTGYTISASGYGTPGTAGFAASDYTDLYYLNQNNGYLYKSNGTSWTYIKTLKLISSELQSQIAVNAENIELKVSKDSVISSINACAESVTISASKVNLQGYVTASALSGAGQTTINGANITTGTVKAERIALYGEMAVYKDSSAFTSANKGGSIGYLSGSHAFSNGTSEDTNGMAMLSRSGDNYLIVTDAGVRMTALYNDAEYKAYLADGHFYVPALICGGQATIRGIVTARDHVTLYDSDGANTLASLWGDGYGGRLYLYDVDGNMRGGFAVLTSGASVLDLYSDSGDSARLNYTRLSRMIRETTHEMSYGTSWGLVFDRVGGLCTISANGGTVDSSHPLPAGAWTTIGTLPEAYRPSRERGFYMTAMSGASPGPLLNIETGGAVKIYNYSSAAITSGWLRVDGTYKIAI